MELAPLLLLRLFSVKKQQLLFDSSRLAPIFSSNLALFVCIFFFFILYFFIYFLPDRRGSMEIEEERDRNKSEINR